MLADRYTAKIGRFRENGATIGKHVRLMGVVDGVSPHLVTIGDHCVLGSESALKAHCPIKGPQPVVLER